MTKIFIAGHRGMVGSAILRKLALDPNVETLLGDPSNAKAKLGWEPKTTFDDLVAETVQEDLKIAKRDEIVKGHGFAVMDYNE